MQKKISRLGLTFMIIACTLVAFAAAIFFINPLIDGIMGVGTAGTYDAVQVFVGGLTAIISFNFGDVWYIVTFALAVLFLLSMIYWLVISIVRKARWNWLTFGFSFVFGAAAIILFAGIAIGPVYREAVVTVVDEEVVLWPQYIIRDLFGEYAGIPMFPIEPGVFEAPLIIYNLFPLVLVFVMLGFVVLAISGFLFNCAYVPSYLFIDEEAREAARARRLAQQHVYEEELITYVDYVSGQEFRDKEYEAICEAHGIKVKKEVVDEDAYYKEIVKDLAVVRGEKNSVDDEYYKETAKQLAILHEQPKVEEEKPVVDERYYQDVVRELGIVQKDPVEVNTSTSDYYEETAKQLAILKQEEKPEAKEFSEEHRAMLSRDEKYYEELKAELGCFEYQKPAVEPKI